MVDGCRRPHERSFCGAAAVEMDREKEAVTEAPQTLLIDGRSNYAKAKSRVATETVTSPALSAPRGVIGPSADAR